MSYSREEFSKHFQSVKDYAEKRRRKYLTYFAVSTAAAILILALLPVYVPPVMDGLVSMTFPEREKSTYGEKIAFSILMAYLSVWLALWPIFAYRGKNKLAGLKVVYFNKEDIEKRYGVLARYMEYPYSLKDKIFSDVLKFFGKFEFAPAGGVFIPDVENSTIIPEIQQFLAEDVVVGVVNDLTVKISETKLVRLINGRRKAVFSGTLIIVDISESAVKLRRNFTGRTVLISDEQKELNEIKEKYSELKKIDLPGKGFEERFEAFTSAPEEATSLLSDNLLRLVEDLQKTVSSSKMQVEHLDGKLAYGFDAFLSSFSFPLKNKYEHDFRYHKQYRASLDLTKQDEVLTDLLSLNRHPQLEFFDDKLVITIPHRADMFEPNSLFEPALNNEDRDLIFALMETLFELTNRLRKYLDEGRG